ncbi:MAG: hypothetical protein BGO65_03680 [Afipia sp. 64-13]|nr:MAG: hypothetical protein BGO65_03680 [Afipia sp. 64-13]
MMPFDVGAHLPIQAIENARTEDLIDPIHSRLDIIADTTRCHLPRTVNRLRGTTLDHSIVKHMSR